MKDLADVAAFVGRCLVPQGPFMGIRFFFGDLVAWHLATEGPKGGFGSLGLWVAGGKTLLVHRVSGGEWLIRREDAPHLISTVGRDLPGRVGGSGSATYAAPVSRFLVPASAAQRIAERFASFGARVDFGGSLLERPLAREADLLVAVVPESDFAGVAVLQQIGATEERLRRLAVEMGIRVYCCETDALPGDPDPDEEFVDEKCPDEKQ